MRKGTMLSLGVLAVIGVFLVYWDGRPSSHPSTMKTVHQLASDEIVAIQLPTVSCARHQAGVSWTMISPEAFDVDEEAIERVVDAIAKPEVDRRLFEKVDQPDEYGLGEGAFRVSWTMKDGMKKALLIGKKTPDLQLFYAKEEGRDAIFTLKSWTAESMMKGCNDLRKKEFLEFLVESVVKVEVGGVRENKSFVKRDDHQWEFDHPKGQRADAAGVESLLRSIRYAKATGFIDRPPDETPYGLAKPTWTVKVWVDTLKAEPKVLWLGKEDYSRYLVYAKVKGGLVVYEVDQSLVKDLSRPTTEYKAKPEPMVVSPSGKPVRK